MEINPFIFLEGEPWDSIFNRCKGIWFYKDGKVLKITNRYGVFYWRAANIKGNSELAYAPDIENAKPIYNPSKFMKLLYGV